MVGKYHVVEQLGAGGMGVVYRARDEELGRDVALKLVTANNAEGDSQGRARLLREAQALARLSHPNVIAVYEVGRYQDGVFLAMELVEGQRVDTWLRTPRGWREVLRVFREAGRGLDAAHAAGLLHRDFKPTNLMLGADGRVRVLDFGLARARGAIPSVRTIVPREALHDDIPTAQSGRTSQTVVEPNTGEADAPAAPQEPTSSSPNLLLTPVTRVGAIVGTPPYMAPEQHDGQVGDERSDQFSFCVAFWQALYGERPFGGATVMELVQHIQTGKIRPPPAGSKVPGFIRQILQRGLSVDPAARWPSMSALLDALANDPAETRRRVLSAGAVVALVGLALFGLVRSRAARPCAGAEKQLEGVWDPARKQAMKAAFLATGKPFAADAWRAVERTFDAYAQGWVSMHTDACEATRVRGEQSAELLDLRMVCLSQRLAGLRAQVDVLTSADAALVERAPGVAQSLDALQPCADVAALKSTTPMPAGAAQRAQVEDVRRQIAKMRALQEAGRLADAKKLIDPTLADARKLAFQPIEAEALLYVSRVQDSSGDYVAAAKTLKDAEVTAEASRYDEVAALAATSLVWVTGERLGKYADAHDLERDARARIARLGGDDRLTADLDSKVGTLYFEEAKFDQAAEYAKRALATREKVLGPDHPLVAGSLGDLGDIASELSRYDEALADYKRAIAISEHFYGTEHPQVASLRINMAAALRMQGHFDEALAEYGRARAIVEKSMGPDHPTLATVLVNVGQIERRQGKLADAKRDLSRALAIWEKALGPEHPSTGTAHYHLGSLALEAKHMDEARSEFERALAIWEKALGAEHPSLAAALTGLGDAALQQGHAREALAHYQRADKLVEKAMGPEHPEVADPLTSMGAAYLELGDKREAQKALTRALKIREKNPGDPRDLEKVRALLARAQK
jgi:tetratricopeptide (TPR) repeat protein